MSQHICVRCRRGRLNGHPQDFAEVAGLCEECEQIVLRTQLPEIRAAILEVIKQP